MPKIGADTAAAPIPTCLRGDPAAQLLGSRSNPLGERAMSGKNRVLKQEAKRREWRVETPWSSYPYPAFMGHILLSVKALLQGHLEIFLSGNFRILAGAVHSAADAI